MDIETVKEESSKNTFGEQESSTVKMPLVDALRFYFQKDIFRMEEAIEGQPAIHR